MKRTRRYPASGIATSDVEEIENRQRAVRVEMRPLLAFTNRVKLHLGLGQESVAIRLVNDAEMARLNETYRKKNGTTDVLSFPAEERRRPGNLRQGLKKVRDAQLGDIAISPVVARRNAKQYGRKLTEEIQILILHGILHLLGYDHETDRGEMEQVELRLRRRLGIA
ncbi:MAG TPA: rRNA maturation RNase YbeY [Candidatus Acidoferrum sp.]|jgi:probable rRNA maturation factor